MYILSNGLPITLMVTFDSSLPLVHFKLSPCIDLRMFGMVAVAVAHFGSELTLTNSNTISPSSLVSVVLKTQLSMTGSLGNTGLVHVIIVDGTLQVMTAFSPCMNLAASLNNTLGSSQKFATGFPWPENKNDYTGFNYVINHMNMYKANHHECLHLTCWFSSAWERVSLWYQTSSANSLCTFTMY